MHGKAKLEVNVNDRLAVAYSWSISRLQRNKLAHIVNGNTAATRYITISANRYEIINVPALGECFYEAIQVAFAFRNKFVSAADVKKDTLREMSRRDEQQSEWFLQLYSQNVDINTRTGRCMNFLQYFRNLSRPREFASIL